MYNVYATALDSLSAADTDFTTVHFKWIRIIFTPYRNVRLYYIVIGI